jgi:hypothetical protein
MAKGQKKGVAGSATNTTANAEPGPLAKKTPATPGGGEATSSAATNAGAGSSTTVLGEGTPPETPQTRLSGTTVLAKSAKLLEFNLRGGATQVIASTWEQLVAITDSEWDDIERTIAEYETQGPPGSFQVDWIKVLATAARTEFLAQHQYRCAVGKEDSDVFDNSKYATKDQLDRIRHVVKKDVGQRATELDVDDQKLQAASAVAAWIKNEATIVPARDANEDYFFKDVREILAKNMQRRDYDLDVLNDADLAESQGIVRELLARINNPDPGNAIWLQAFGDTIKATMTSKEGKLTIMDIVKAHNRHIMDLKEEIKNLNAKLPKAWQSEVAKPATTAAPAASAPPATKAPLHAMEVQESGQVEDPTTTKEKQVETAELNYNSGGRFRDYRERDTRSDRGNPYYRRQSYGGGGRGYPDQDTRNWKARGNSPASNRDWKERGRSGSRDRHDRRSRSRSPGKAKYHDERTTYQGGTQPTTSGRSDSKERYRSRSRSPGYRPSDGGGRGRGGRGGGGRGRQSNTRDNYADRAQPAIECNGCGNTHRGGRPQCMHKWHPDFNYQKDTAWGDSVAGQRLSRLGYHKLQPGKRTVTYPDGTVQMENFEVNTNSIPDDSTWCIDQEGNPMIHKISNTITNETIDICTLYGSEARAKPCRAERRRAARKEQRSKLAKPSAYVNEKEASVLMDSGAINRNFVSRECCERLKLPKYVLKEPIKVTSIHGEETATHVVVAKVELHSQGEVANLKWIELVVIKNAPTEIVIGMPTLLEHAVFKTLSRHFNTGQSAGGTLEKSGDAQRRTVSWKRVQSALTALGASKEQKRLYKKAHISELLNVEPNEDPTEDLLPEDIYATYFQDPTQEKGEIKFTVYGTETEQRTLNALLHRYASVFSDKVGDEAAKVTPMTIDVDVAAWHDDKRSREPTRSQSAARKIAIDRWIRQAIADNVIRPSQAAAWSQLHLTPKPNGTWRFNVDYRALNRYTRAARALIPNIAQLLRHIGAQNPKRFAKMDMTSGFHQMAIDERYRHLTAFAAGSEIYEFNRVSMGLMNAPWYFQQALSREVFPHLLHRIMEIYIDDLLTWAQSFEELINNLEKIFDTLQKHKLTVNPEKCSFGMTEVEFVGHVIDNQGITFSHKKLEKVANMPIPETKGELKTFLGAAGYMRNHVRKYGELTKPLQDLVGDNYTKSKAKQPLEWTDELKSCYERAQRAVLNCTKLHYVQPNGDIRVYTDASEYGIGAYLCQVIDGEEKPIEFISKTLTKPEQRWATIEREAYAIFYALRKWETHLRDIHFTLFTDHENLTFIDTTTSAKVVRWKLAVQDYKCDVVYIPGEENVVADAMSRMCAREPPPEITQREDELRTSINALSVAKELMEWKPNTQNIEEERDQYWLETSEEVSAFYNLMAHKTAITQKRTRRERATHVPPHLWKLLQKCHNADVGHWGVNRTLELLQETLERDPTLLSQPWPAMRRDVETYIHKCDSCIKTSEQKVKQMTRKFVTSSYGVFENIAIDALAMETSKNGNKYLLTIIDTATRYIILKPLKDLTARVAAQALIEYMCVYGIPIHITSDNSTEFKKEFEEMVNILRTENYKIQPYSHEENSIVERANKEIRRHMRVLTYENRTRQQWDMEYLKVQAILNEKVSEATGLKPNEIVFAGKVNLHEGRLFPRPTAQQQQRMSDFMKEQIDLQEHLIKIMEENQHNKDEKHMKDQKITMQLLLGTYIVCRHEGGQKSKQQTRWHGPYRIIKTNIRPQGTVYTVFNAKKGTEEDYHEAFVKPYPCNPEFGDYDALKMAVLDTDMYIVEKILDHRFKATTKEIQLLIQWYGDNEPEWCEYNSTMSNNILVLRYFKSKGLENLIPTKHKRRTDLEEPIKIKRVRFGYKENVNKQ